jgi:hypothetical protein
MKYGRKARGYVKRSLGRNRPYPICACYIGMRFTSREGAEM